MNDSGHKSPVKRLQAYNHENSLAWSSSSPLYQFECFSPEGSNLSYTMTSPLCPIPPFEPETAMQGCKHVDSLNFFSPSIFSPKERIQSALPRKRESCRNQSIADRGSIAELLDENSPQSIRQDDITGTGATKKVFSPMESPDRSGSLWSTVQMTINKTNKTEFSSFHDVTFSTDNAANIISTNSYMSNSTPVKQLWQSVSTESKKKDRQKNMYNLLSPSLLMPSDTLSSTSLPSPLSSSSSRIWLNQKVDGEGLDDLCSNSSCPTAIGELLLREEEGMMMDPTQITFCNSNSGLFNKNIVDHNDNNVNVAGFSFNNENVRTMNTRESSRRLSTGGPLFAHIREEIIEGTASRNSNAYPAHTDDTILDMRQNKWNNLATAVTTNNGRVNISNANGNNDTQSYVNKALKDNCSSKASSTVQLLSTLTTTTATTNMLNHQSLLESSNESPSYHNLTIRPQHQPVINICSSNNSSTMIIPPPSTSLVTSKLASSTNTSSSSSSLSSSASSSYGITSALKSSPPPPSSQPSATKAKRFFQNESNTEPQRHQQSSQCLPSEYKAKLISNTGESISFSSTSSPVSAASTATTVTVCNCKKSKCLKLYCDCFAVLNYCNPAHCNCFECCNTKQNEDMRQEAVRLTKERNANAFQTKFKGLNEEDSSSNSSSISNSSRSKAEQKQQYQLPQHSVGCHCKNSQCLKKYCECFTGGVFCGGNCKCQSCLNFNGSDQLVKTRVATNTSMTTTNNHIMNITNTTTTTSVVGTSRRRGSINSNRKRKESPCSVATVAATTYHNEEEEEEEEADNDNVDVLMEEVKGRSQQRLTTKCCSSSSSNSSKSSRRSPPPPLLPSSSSQPQRHMHKHLTVSDDSHHTVNGITNKMMLPLSQVSHCREEVSGIEDTDISSTIAIQSSSSTSSSSSVPNNGFTTNIKTAAEGSSEAIRATRNSINNNYHYNSNVANDGIPYLLVKKKQVKFDTISSTSTSAVTIADVVLSAANNEEDSVVVSSLPSSSQPPLPVYAFFGSTIPDMPKLIALRCLDYLQGKDIYAMSQVNSIWSQAAMDDALWE